MVGLNLENTVPMRWPSGPLEIARREKRTGFSARVRQSLERWHEPAALEILQNTPIDCLVISWAAGLPADAEQWRTAVPLIEAARRRNLAVLGWVDGAADHRLALAAAKTAGLVGSRYPRFPRQRGSPCGRLERTRRRALELRDAGSGHCRQRLARCEYHPRRRRR